MTNQIRYFNTVVIGGGQSGLAAGYFLKKSNIEFLILDKSRSIGESWSRRWDSLQLFTPNWTNCLPGMRFPKTANKFATKDEVASFLRLYTEKYNLAVQLKTSVEGLTKIADDYEIKTNAETFHCKHIIVATGNFQIPKIPAIASQLDKQVFQIHSGEYRNINQLPDGPVLVVGAATSGLQIAMDLARSGRKIYISGNPPMRIPDFATKYLQRFSFWFMKNVLTVKTKPGRKVEFQIKEQGKAAPLIGIGLEDVIAKGAEHVPKLEKISSGLPEFKDGKTLDVKNVIWCTGFSRDFSWIQLENIADTHGYPLTQKGLSDRHAGLYFMGMMFQYGLTSAQINGVGRDADYIVKHIRKFGIKN